MAKIKKIVAREILDSRGNPTIEVAVQLEDQAVGIYSVPSGVSVGKYEAQELRDEDPKRYQGRGVLKNLEKIVNVVAPQIIGKEASDQKGVDLTMTGADGTQNKSNLGANTILAVSGAVAKASAASIRMPLYQYIARLAESDTREFTIPTPMFNILNGGKHGGGNLDFQEFLMVPPQAKAYSSSLRMGAEIYYSLREIIISHNASYLVGDEGGYAPTLYSNLDAFKILEETVAKAGYNVGLDVFFSLDVAAESLRQGSAYKIKDRPVALTASDFIDYFIGLNEQYHLLSLEDPLGEDEWEDWQTITAKIGTETLLVGDDLIATNRDRLERAISSKACNAVIIKPNQAGTVSETLEVIKIAKNASFKTIVSHRSGETNDDFIADFAVGVGADYLKFGAPARGERVAKYNRLLEIEHDLA